jgi:hypothetical protein
MALIRELYRRCGAMNLIAAGLFVTGGLAMLYSLANQGGLEMSCERYVAQKPIGKWAKLEGCVLSRIESVAKSSAGNSAMEVYIPVRPVTEKGRADTHILLASTAPDDLAFVNQANGPESQRVSRGAFLATFGSKIEETRPIEGRIVRGAELTDRERAKLLKMLPTLAPDFVIVEECERPGLALPAMLLLVAAVLGGIRVYPWLKQKMRNTAPVPAEEMFPAK